MNTIDQQLDSIQQRTKALGEQINQLIAEVHELKPTIQDATQGKRCHRIEIELLNIRDMANPSRR